VRGREGGGRKEGRGVGRERRWDENRGAGRRGAAPRRVSERNIKTRITDSGIRPLVRSQRGYRLLSANRY